jgi:hypothetical protein
MIAIFASHPSNACFLAVSSLLWRVLWGQLEPRLMLFFGTGIGGEDTSYLLVAVLHSSDFSSIATFHGRCWRLPDTGAKGNMSKSLPTCMLTSANAQILRASPPPICGCRNENLKGIFSGLPVLNVHLL